MDSPEGCVQGSCPSGLPLAASLGLGVVGWAVLKDVFRGLVLQVRPLPPVWHWRTLWGGQS